METKHRAVATFKVGGFTIKFRPPTQEEWDTHQKKLRSDKHSKSPAFRELCQQTLITPIEDFLAVIKGNDAKRGKAALPAVACRALGKLAGRDLSPIENPDRETCTLELEDGSGRSWTFNTPEFDTWEDCQEQLAAGKNEREPVFRELAVRCLVDQSQRASLESFFAEYPAGHEGLANALTALAGGDIEGEVKKE